MQTRQCSWCSKTVDKTMNFCSEKCVHEYNTAKSTKLEMINSGEMIKRHQANVKNNFVVYICLISVALFWLIVGLVNRWYPIAGLATFVLCIFHILLFTYRKRTN